MTASLAAAALVVVLASGGPAQTVYRCGPDRNIYSQTPCADGTSIHTEDRRTAQQRAEAEAAARKEAGIGVQMERERLAREAATRGSTAISLNQVKPVAHAASAPKAAKRKSSKQKKDEDLKIIVPAAKPKKPAAP